MQADNHTHTRFSPDSVSPPQDMIERAISLGLKQITITDHCDPCHPEGLLGLTDTTEYVKTLRNLKAKYARDIYVCIGVEIGYLPEAVETASAIAAADGIEYIIDSVHVVSGSDCYDPSHYARVSRQAAYDAYFKAVIESLAVPYRYDAVGHVGYIERKAPYPDKHITYEAYKDYLDPIFDTLIAREKILEMNTNAASPLFSLPSADLVAAYYRRGGRLVALSSDAHDPKRIGDKFAEGERILREIGFTYVSAMRDGKRVEYKI